MGFSDCESLGPEHDPAVPSRLAAEFRANYTTSAVDPGGGGKCSVEMGQENLIALLLKQQEEMLQEIKSQKQGLQLSQANKEEISRLVLSAIKQHTQPGRKSLSAEQFAERNRARRGKHVRRRRKLARSAVNNGRHSPHDSKQFSESSNARSSYDQAIQHVSNVAPGDPSWCHSDSVLIRQSLEQRPAPMEVSLEGLWLPSLSPLAAYDTSAAAVEEEEKEGHQPAVGSRWAEKSAAVPAAIKFSEAGVPTTQKGLCIRPATVAAKAALTRSCDGKTETVPTAGGRSGAATAVGVRRHDATAVVGENVRLGMVNLPRRTDEAKSRHRRVSEESWGRASVRCPSDEEGEGDEDGENTEICQHTASMLARSRVLVAKAKACCGHVARVIPPDHGEEAREQERAALGTRGDGATTSCDTGAELGQTRSILFPSLSTSPLDEDCMEAPRGPSVAFPNKSSFDLAEESSSHSTNQRRSSPVIIATQPPDMGDVEGKAKKVAIILSESLVQATPAKSLDPPGVRVQKPQEQSVQLHHEGDQVGKRCSRDVGVAAVIDGRSSGGLASVNESEGTPANNKITSAPTVPKSSVHQPSLPEPQTREAVPTQQTHKRPTTAMEGGGGTDHFDRVSSMGSRSSTVARFHESDTNRRRRSHRGGRGKRSVVTAGEGSDGGNNSAKVDIEWENEIARNILSLYQTRLRVGMAEKRGTMEEESDDVTPGYQTLDEEEALAEEHAHTMRNNLLASPSRTTSHTRSPEPRHRSLSRVSGNGKHSARRSPASSTMRSKNRPLTSAARFLGNDVNNGTTLPVSARGQQDLAAGGGGAGRNGSNRSNGTHDVVRLTTTAPTASDTTGKIQARDGPRVTPATAATVCRKQTPTLTPTRKRRTASSGRCRERYPNSPGRPSTVAAVSGSKCTSGTTAARNVPATARAGGGTAAGRGGFRGNTTISVPTRGGGEVVVIVPKRPSPIWFAGSGAVQAEWSALPGGARVVRDLEGLEEQGRYSKYVAVVEGLLVAHLRADDLRGPPELVKRLWRQLVVTCTAFGVRSTENRRFERALELLKRATTLISREVLDKQANAELKAFIFDAYGLYYLRRGKSTAALDYVQKAMKTHARMQDWGHITKCHLHSAMVLSRLNRHDEALRCLGQVLAAVQEGKLDVGGNSPQKLCLVAICYHNIAVEQLILRHVGEACMSSQNARRLARLCLSYSNRWLRSFEGTHKLALAELARSLPSIAGGAGRRGADARTDQDGRLGAGAIDRGGDGDRQGSEQQALLKRLTEELFS